jgi:hypothetical protein
MPGPALIKKLHMEIVIGCEIGECHEVFLSTELPTAPIEQWSKRAALEAGILGWSAPLAGLVLRPKHGPLSKTKVTP